MKEKLRVAYFTHYADLYGANRSLLALMLPLRDAGHVAPHVVVASDGPMVQRLKEEGIPHVVIPFSPWMVKRVYSGRLHHRIQQWLGHRKLASRRIASDKKNLKPVLESLARWKIDLLHVNSSVIGIGHGAAIRSKIPMIWHVREFPFKHYHLYPDVGHRGFYKALRKADRVIAISNAVKDDLTPMMSSDKLPVVIYNGIIYDQEYKRLASEPGPVRYDERSITFTMIGYLHRSKGQLEGIRAFAKMRAQLPSARLLIAGSGDDAPLRRSIMDLGIQEHVEFTGFVSDPDSIYRRTDVLLNCSRYEALGRVTIEAMSHKIPVIGHASGGTIELIEHGNSGYLYTHEVELVGCMKQLASDPQLAVTMGMKAFASLEGRFSIEARAKDVQALYEEVISDRSR